MLLLYTEMLGKILTAIAASNSAAENESIVLQLDELYLKIFEAGNRDSGGSSLLRANSDSLLELAHAVAEIKEILAAKFAEIED